MNPRLRTFTGAAALLGALSIAGCSGGSSSDSSSDSFAVDQISVDDGTVWQLNRRMEFRFTAPVDFASVNLSTINITQVGGAPAVGSFSLLDPQTVAFQPACPTESDYSDAGLLPGTATAPGNYEINIVGSSSGGATVRSTSGESLTQGQTVSFTTPSSTAPLSSLFIDTAIGPPTPVIRTDGAAVEATYIEIGEDPQNRVYFEPRPVVDATLGATTPAGFEAPLNLYSDVGTRVVIVLYLNQAVDPAASNINADTLLLEYQSGPTTWERIPHTIELVGNCTATGSIIHVQPLGILPQGRTVRTVLAPGLSDVVLESNSVPVVVGAFTVDTVGAGGDELLDEFTADGSAEDSFEDSTSALPEPRAVWGDGQLEAAFAFDGTGGPGGEFDYTVSTDTILNTSFAVITSADSQFQQTVINGRVDVQNFHVTSTGSLTIQGPNPCKILASGTVLIEGTISINGNKNDGVGTLGTTNIPEVGASGNCGGGRGGAGSYLTTQSTPQGEAGYGAFNVVGAGGGGGESAYNASTNDNTRRPGGGGGGALGKDVVRPSATNGFTVANPNNCPDQTLVGLDVEAGFPGWPAFAGNNGALHPGFQPQGGSKGPRPFFDDNPNNDFWGTMRTAAGALIQGELQEPWAGAGGGGGGDAIKSTSFPLTPFDPSGDEKGAGGGGGAGSLTILALGEIRFGTSGRIEAKGGHGGGGENSSSGGVTRIGGGSGGGSGGHVVLQSATEIDFASCRSAFNGGIYLLGGQGGAGANNKGGAIGGLTLGGQVQPIVDALPPNAYPSASAPCAMNSNMGPAYSMAPITGTNIVGNISAANIQHNANDPNTVVAGAGGDGGPGILQLHTPSLANIIPPSNGPAQFEMYKILRPPPIGATSNNVNTPQTGGVPVWDQTVPIFGRRSMAQSKWIPLGLANIAPGSPVPVAVNFEFEGTDPALGFVQKTGVGPNQVVAELPPIFSGVLAASPATPHVTSDDRTVVFGATGFDPVYKQNPLLMRRFSIKLTHAGQTKDFEVGTATYDSALDQIQATVSASGLPLEAYVPGDAVVLIPRFFRIQTEDVVDALPASSTIKIEFQATSETAQGGPNLSIGPTGGSDWVTDIDALDAHANAANFRFLRFRVTFDILADNSNLNFDTPIPAIDFMRVPFKF